MISRSNSIDFHKRDFVYCTVVRFRVVKNNFRRLHCNILHPWTSPAPSSHVTNTQWRIIVIIVFNIYMLLGSCLRSLHQLLTYRLYYVTPNRACKLYCLCIIYSDNKILCTSLDSVSIRSNSNTTSKDH